MCNFSSAIREEGREEGRLEGRHEVLLETTIAFVKNLMKSLNCTSEKAMDMLDIQGQERREVEKALQS